MTTRGFWIGVAASLWLFVAGLVVNGVLRSVGIEQQANATLAARAGEVRLKHGLPPDFPVLFYESDEWETRFIGIFERQIFTYRVHATGDFEARWRGTASFMARDQSRVYDVAQQCRGQITRVAENIYRVKTLDLTGPC